MSHSDLRHSSYVRIALRVVVRFPPGHASTFIAAWRIRPTVVNPSVVTPHVQPQLHAIAVSLIRPGGAFTPAGGFISVVFTLTPPIRRHAGTITMVSSFSPQ